MENLETSIRRHLMSYLAGEMSLDDFQDWLIGATWHADDVLEPAAAELTYSIEHALAEASAGLLSRDELNAQLRSLLVAVPPAPALQAFRHED